MKVPVMERPSPGWTWRRGRLLLAVNWARSWDGWGRTLDDGNRVEYQLACLVPFVATYGYGALLTLWKLKVQVGISASIPKGGGET